MKSGLKFGLSTNAIFNNTGADAVCGYRRRKKILWCYMHRHERAYHILVVFASVMDDLYTIKQRYSMQNRLKYFSRRYCARGDGERRFL